MIESNKEMNIGKKNHLNSNPTRTTLKKIELPPGGMKTRKRKTIIRQEDRDQEKEKKKKLTRRRRNKKGCRKVGKNVRGEGVNFMHFLFN